MAGTTPRLRKTQEEAQQNEEEDADDNAVLAFLKRRFKNHKNQVQEVWEEAAERFENFSRNSDLPAAYPPGRCAAPKALVLVMEDKAFPGGITEQWFHPQGKPTRGKIKYRDRTSGTVVAGPFDHGKTVPPCNTCNLLLPMMICPEVQETQCQHKGK